LEYLLLCFCAPGKIPVEIDRYANTMKSTCSQSTPTSIMKSHDRNCCYTGNDQGVGYSYTKKVVNNDQYSDVFFVNGRRRSL